MQCSHQTPRSEPGEEPPPLPEPGEPVPKPGEPPREPGELVPMPGEAGPGEPVKEPGEEVPEPGDGVPEEPRAEPAPSGAGRPPARDSSYAFRYQLSGEKGAAGLVGEQGSVTPYFLLRAVTAILSLFPATEFMVASQGGGRIS